MALSGWSCGIGFCKIAVVMVFWVSGSSLLQLVLQLVPLLPFFSGLLTLKNRIVQDKLPVGVLVLEKKETKEGMADPDPTSEIRNRQIRGIGTAIRQKLALIGIILVGHLQAFFYYIGRMNEDDFVNRLLGRFEDAGIEFRSQHIHYLRNCGAHLMAMFMQIEQDLVNRQNQEAEEVQPEDAAARGA